MNIKEVADKFIGTKKQTSRGWKVCCPCHGDEHPSVDIEAGTNKGTILVKCRVGCETDDILEKVGLTWADLGAGKAVKSQRKARVKYKPFKGDLHDAVYRGLLAELVLSTEHEQHLRERGISHEAISWGMFRTLDSESNDRACETLATKYGVAELLTVPGFVADQGKCRLSIHAGLAIPVFGCSQAIRGIKVRVEGNPKYIWLSTPGISCGSPCYVPPSVNKGVGRVRLTEGELKAVVSTDRGVPALSVSGVSNWASALPALRALQVQGVQVAFDSDFRSNAAVRSALRECLRTLRQIGLKVEVATWDDFKGVDDAIVGNAPITVRPAAEFLATLVDDAQEDGTWEVSDLASSFSVQPIQWIWPGWLPRGALTILDGDPGRGKSQITSSIVAAITRSGILPDGVLSRESAGALLLSAEDDPERVIVPRLDAAGADLTKVRLLRYFVDKGGRRLPNFPEDFDRLEEVLSRGNYGLVVVDPLMAYLDGEVNSHNDQDVRRVLSRLTQIAEESQTAILCVRHLNKSSGTTAIYRGGGSIGIIGTARVGWLVGQDPDKPNLNILAVSKSNLAEKPKSRRYHMESASVEIKGTTVATSRIKWLGASDKIADDLVAPKEDKEAVPVEAQIRERMLELGVGQLSWDTLEDQFGNLKYIAQASWDKHGIERREDGLYIAK